MPFASSPRCPAPAAPAMFHGTHELIVSSTPYIAPYRVKGDVIEIITALRGAQRWPDRLP